MKFRAKTYHECAGSAEDEEDGEEDEDDEEPEDPLAWMKKPPEPFSTWKDLGGNQHQEPPLNYNRVRSVFGWDRAPGPDCTIIWPPIEDKPSKK